MAESDHDLRVVQLAVDPHRRFRGPAGDIESVFRGDDPRLGDALFRSVADVPLRARAETREQPREEDVSDASSGTDAEDHQHAFPTHARTSAECSANATAVQLCCASTPRA
jgi:hypothetical protein